MSKLYNTQTRKLETVPEEQIESAIRTGSHSYKKGTKVNVLDQNKESYTVDASELNGVLDSGFSIETPTQSAVREYVKDNEGLKGTVKVALGQFADEALLGLPEIIMDKTQDPLEVAKRQALKEDHQIANSIGGVAGFGASLFAGPAGLVSKGATAAGKATERAVASRLADAGVERGAKAIAKDIAARIGTNAAKMGVEGAVLAAPKAITEAGLGDIDTAAETLMMGGALGTAFGAGSGVISGLGKIGSEYGSKVANTLKEKGLDFAENSLLKQGVSQDAADLVVRGKVWDPATIQKRWNLADEDMLRLSESGVMDKLGQPLDKETLRLFRSGLVNKDKDKIAEALWPHSQEGALYSLGLIGEKEAKKGITAGVKDLMKAASSKTLKNEDALGALAVDWLVGAVLPRGVGATGYFAYKAIKDAKPLDVTKGLLYAEKAMRMTADAIDSIPGKIDNLGAMKSLASKGVSKSSASLGAVGRFLGTDSKDDVENLETLRNQLAEYTSNPAAAMAKTSQKADLLTATGAPQVADAWAAKNALMAKYLLDTMPKPTAVKNPLNQRKWKPSDLEMAKFERRIEAVNNPLSLIDDLERGTLRKESVEAVKTLYPKLFQAMQSKIMNHLMDPESKVPYSARTKLALLLELPSGTDATPETIRYLQGNFSKEDQAAKTSTGAPTTNQMASEMQKLTGQ